MLWAASVAAVLATACDKRDDDGELGEIPECVDCIDAAGIGPIADEPPATSRVVLSDETPTHPTLVGRWVALAQAYGDGPVAVVRARVEGRRAARSAFAAGEAPTIHTELALKPLAVYCGSVPDPLVASYRGGRLPSGETERTSELPIDLAVGEEYVLLLLGQSSGKLVISGRHTIAVVGPPGMKTYRNRLDPTALASLTGVCP